MIDVVVLHARAAHVGVGFVWAASLIDFGTWRGREQIQLNGRKVLWKLRCRQTLQRVH